MCVYIYVFKKLIKKRERDHAVCHVLHLAFLLTKTSWCSFSIHVVHFTSTWVFNIGCALVYLASTFLMGKHLLKTSGGSLASSMLFISKRGRIPISFIQNPTAPEIVQPGPQHLANTATERSRGSGYGVKSHLHQNGYHLQGSHVVTPTVLEDSVT